MNHGQYVAVYEENEQRTTFEEFFLSKNSSLKI